MPEISQSNTLVWVTSAKTAAARKLELIFVSYDNESID